VGDAVPNGFLGGGEEVDTPLDPFSFTFTALSGNTYLLEVKYLP
jgi:hypothetical protein